MSRRLIIRSEAEDEVAEAFEWYEECVVVLAVFHAKRDPKRWQDRI